MDVNRFFVRSALRLWIATVVFTILYVVLRHLSKAEVTGIYAQYFIPLILAATVVIGIDWAVALWRRDFGRLSRLKQSLRAMSPFQAYFIYGFGVYTCPVFLIMLTIRLEAGANWADSLWPSAVQSALISMATVALHRWVAMHASKKHEPERPD